MFAQTFVCYIILVFVVVITNAQDIEDMSRDTEKHNKKCCDTKDDTGMQNDMAPRRRFGHNHHNGVGPPPPNQDFLEFPLKFIPEVGGISSSDLQQYSGFSPGRGMGYHNYRHSGAASVGSYSRNAMQTQEYIRHAQERVTNPFLDTTVSSIKYPKRGRITEHSDNLYPERKITTNIPKTDENVATSMPENGQKRNESSKRTDISYSNKSSKQNRQKSSTENYLQTEIQNNTFETTVNPIHGLNITNDTMYAENNTIGTNGTTPVLDNRNFVDAPPKGCPKGQERSVGAECVTSF